MQCSKTTEQYNNKRIVVVLSLIGSEERTSGQWPRSVGVGIVIDRDAADLLLGPHVTLRCTGKTGSSIPGLT